jgi:hypothetical protein
MLKIRRMVPGLLRAIAILGLLGAIVAAILSLKPDEVVKEKFKYGSGAMDYEMMETTVPNPFTIPLAVAIAVSSVMIFGFASIVEASEKYLSQTSYEEGE